MSKDPSQRRAASEQRPESDTTLIAAEKERAGESRMRVTAGGHEWIVGSARAQLTFGRTDANDVALGDEYVSREHGAVIYRDGQVRLTDHSTNGTLITRGASSFYVHQETVLLFGEGELRLGRLGGATLRFTVESLADDGRTWQPTWLSQAEADLGSVQGNVLRREGDFWTLAYEGTVLRMKDAKALHYLAHLVRHPGQEIAALDLVLMVSGAPREDDRTVTRARGTRDDTVPLEHSSTGATLDASAKEAYRRRLADLQEELAEAEGFSDIGRAERAREEIAFLERELSAAVGLGGRDRPAGSQLERARVGVTVPLKTLVKKLLDCHPALGHHLSATIKTGRYCSYSPDPTHPVSWTL